MNTGRAIGMRAARRFALADGGLAVLVIGVVALMVVPLPTWLLDVLLASNLAVSVAILLVTLYVGRALELTTFPTLLLITTLVRVALNVSSTRLILLHADAGQVIRAFGSFVVSGNFVVGAVVFLIITVIQFVVVARGSERVAEVAARFTLDALPGKQMAIDAELRAGILDRDAAHVRRQRLEQESQFYGAMDGAAKFVKGDVIATLLIAVINIVGGVAIGVGQRGMDLTAALHRYGLLTIGDGLVTQIPALLLATAAGILVTRVPSEDGHGHGHGDGHGHGYGETALGAELSAQLLGVPRALTASSMVIALLAAVPGLPAAPLLVTAIALFAASRLGNRQRRERMANARGFGARGFGARGFGARSFGARGFGARAFDGGRGDAGSLGLDRGAFVPEVIPWSMDVSRDLSVALRAELTSLPERLRERVFHELGVALPPCHVEVDDALPDATAVLSIREVPAALIDLTVPETANSDPHSLASLDAPGSAVLDARRSAAPPDARGSVAEFDDPRSAAARIEARAAALLLERAADFLGISETKALLDSLEAVSPATVRQVVPKFIDVATLSDVLRLLVEERLGIRDLRAILEAVARAPANDRDAATLVEHVRGELRRPITWELTAGEPFIEVVTLDVSIEDAIRGAITKTSAGAYLTLAPSASADIVQAVQNALAKIDPPLTHDVVILTRPDIRRFVRELLDPSFPRLRVISFTELLPETQIRSRSRATLYGR